MLAGDCLYLSIWKTLYIYQLQESAHQPLKYLTYLNASDDIYKMVIFGSDLIMGEHDGYLEFVDLNKKGFASSHRFEQGSHINDVLPIILGSQYLLGTNKGILLTSRDTLVKHY